MNALARVLRLMGVALAGPRPHFKQGAVGALFVAAMLTAPAAAETAPKFDLPVRCTVVGDTANPCRIQNRVDMDPTDTRLDGLCQRHTYNNHKGTDFRVVTLADMATNIPVYAMADGTVVGSRDGMADVAVGNAASRKAVKNRECGNGLMVKHAGGWTTQYCHLKRGSVKVAKGQGVKRGDRIGAIGLSGYTQFPHVHVSVRRGKQVIDPLSGRPMGQAACNSGGAKAIDPTTALFSAEAVARIKRFATPHMNSGFSSAIVKREQALAGNLPKPEIGTPLVFYAFMMNLNKGDRLRITVRETPTAGGAGKIWSQQTSKPLPVDRPSHIIYAGRKSGGRARHRYRGFVELIRDGKVIFTSVPKSVRF